MLLERRATERVRDLLGAFRIVVLAGARQTGKTTLVRDLLGLPDDACFSFDDPAILARAQDDPVGFVASLPRPAAIDECQRAGSPFLLAIKQAADREPQRGQFLLTGSTSYLADRSVAETLAGRVGRVSLWPLSVGERLGVRETFLDALFDEGWRPDRGRVIEHEELIATILQGGYPELVTEALSGPHRRRWFDGYVSDVVSREALRPLAEIRMEHELRAVLRLLAARTAQELVISDLARDAGLSRETTANYVMLLEALHLVCVVPAWATSATTRAKRRSKVFVVDTGLAADLVGAGESEFGPRADGRLAGALLETLVATELLKQVSWSDQSIAVSHYRDRNGPEVDFILEDRRRGRVVGVEVKLTATPTTHHARHLALLRDRLGERFAGGVLLHTGPHPLPLGERLWALPVSALWS